MIYDAVRSFRRKMNGEGVIGTFSKTSDPAFIEIIGYGGFDFVIIDLEHGPNSVQSAQNLIRAAQVVNLFPVVRVKEFDLSVIGEALDVGAGGVQVPQITDPESANGSVRRAKFAPEGSRGVCRFVRAAGYSAMDRFDYFRKANDTLVVLQLEGKEAVARLEGIVGTKGIDVLFIGPYDLSQSLGVPGEVDHPLVEGKMRDIVSRCARGGVIVGTFVDTIESARKWSALGVRYLAYSVDVGLFYEKCAAVVRDLRARPK
jgi:4-hydroxy-2-oxoheptanedioate aldolase